SLVWLETTLDDGQPYRRLMVAQDTGGAIAGGPRADVFFGRGERAEWLAGTQKSRGRLYVFQPVESDAGG
ncbi:MAG: 3D domain-containing protein, partial [Pseudomonadota bacterium]